MSKHQTLGSCNVTPHCFRFQPDGESQHPCELKDVDVLEYTTLYYYIILFSLILLQHTIRNYIIARFDRIQGLQEQGFACKQAFNNFQNILGRPHRECEGLRPARLMWNPKQPHFKLKSNLKGRPYILSSLRINRINTAPNPYYTL